VALLAATYLSPAAIVAPAHAGPGDPPGSADKLARNFEQLVDRYLCEVRGVDCTLPGDMSAESFASRIRAQEAILADLEEIDRGTLTLEQDIDWRFLRGILKGNIRAEREVERWRQDPRRYVFTNGIIFKIQSDHRHPEERGRALVSELRTMRARMANAEDNLTQYIPNWLVYSNARAEANPALGLRAIRFSFRYREIFNQQLRAILRAAAETQNARIMFPMISSLDDFREAKQAVVDCMQELAQKKLPHHQNPFVGALIEIPSVVEIIDELAAESDFLSIGTNDFVQYMLAVDRANEKVNEFYRPDHPAVLRGLAKISKASNVRQKELSICGEMAHEPAYIPFLLGIGVQIFSVYPKFLPSVQKIIGGFTLSDAKIYADQLLAESTLKGVRKALTRLSKRYNLNPSKGRG